MIPLICPQNVDGVSLDAAAFTLSNLCEKPSIALLSTLFRSDQPPFDHKKMDKELVDKFLWRGVYCHIGIKDFLPKQASFCKYTWEVVAYMVITNKGRSSPDIWPETRNQSTRIKNMIFKT